MRSACQAAELELGRASTLARARNCGRPGPVSAVAKDSRTIMIRRASACRTGEASAMHVSLEGAEAPYMASSTKQERLLI